MNQTGVVARITELLAQQCGSSSGIASLESLRGGDGSAAYHVTLRNGAEYFCKVARAATAAEQSRFRVEADTLILLHQTQTFTVPVPVACNEEMLILPWLNLQRPGPQWQEVMGRTLAQLHLATRTTRHGFHSNNWLGKSLQHNDWSDDWCIFWQQQRHMPQHRKVVALLGTDDPLARMSTRLIERIPDLLAGTHEPPVLLHGDLWSGNTGADGTGHPVLLDPASYYGQREAEFGMMRMFHGFSSRCEDAYSELWPLAQGFATRLPLYQLYHELNHLLLFGDSYYQSVRDRISSLL